MRGFNAKNFKMFKEIGNLFKQEWMINDDYLIDLLHKKSEYSFIKQQKDLLFNNTPVRMKFPDGRFFKD